MLRKVINPILFLPIVLFINPLDTISSETQTRKDKILEEKANNTSISYGEIEKIVLNNPELTSLKNLINSAKFNLSSKIAQRYPTLDIQSN